MRNRARTDNETSSAESNPDFVKLDHRFFQQSAPELARALLGVVMVRRVDGVVRQARLVEVEAYCGPSDLASHSSKGRTKRTEVMFGPPGRAYVYFIYGMHWMFNIVCGVQGEAHAVLLRGAEPLDGWEANLIGPARLARGFGVTRSNNGMEITGPDIRFLSDAAYEPRVIRAKRVGVDYAGPWKDRLLRFIDTRNPSLSKRIVK